MENREWYGSTDKNYKETEVTDNGKVKGMTKYVSSWDTAESKIFEGEKLNEPRFQDFGMIIYVYSETAKEEWYYQVTVIQKLTWEGMTQTVKT